MNKLFVAALAAVTLISCNKDDLSQENNGGQGQEGAPTIAEITIKAAGVNTRAAAESEEKTIKTATVYVFRDNGMYEDHFDLDVDPAGATATKVVQTTVGDKYFYALVNAPTTDFTLPNLNVTNMYTFEKVVVGTYSAITSLTTNDNFFMTNTAHPGKTTIVQATQAQAPTVNPVVIPVGRATVKAQLRADAAVHIDGRLSDISFRVRNNPINMNLMPYVDPNGTTGYLEAWGFGLTYDPDNYFHNGGSAMYGRNTAGGASVPYSATAFTALSAGNGPASEYAMENSNEGIDEMTSPMKGQATYLSISGIFTPSTWLNPDGTPGTPNAGNTFWRIARVDANNLIVSYEDGYYNAQPTATSPQIAVEYTGGRCYYALWLADNTKTDLVVKYTVKRNSFYDVSIRQINGAGAPGEEDGGGEPTDPIEESAWLDASIQVLDWTDVEQGAGI